MNKLGLLLEFQVYLSKNFNLSKFLVLLIPDYFKTFISPNLVTFLIVPISLSFTDRYNICYSPF